MSLLLVIDTSGEKAFVALSNDGKIMIKRDNVVQNQHASFIHIAIKELFETAGIPMDSIAAIAVVNGPGSYTGLRVGLATAKGICYTLDKPLILLNTLHLMAIAIGIKYIKEAKVNGDELICPMIDARRAEVYITIYDMEYKQLLPFTNWIVGENSFDEYLQKGSLVFGGNACNKVADIIKKDNCIYYPDIEYAEEACIEAQKQFDNKNFSSVAYSEPYYLKEFYSNKG